MKFPFRVRQIALVWFVLATFTLSCGLTFRPASPTVTPAPLPTDTTVPAGATQTAPPATATPLAPLPTLASPTPASAEPSATAMPTLAEHPTPPAEFQGLLFGPFHLPEADFSTPFTGAFRALQEPSEVDTVLGAARKAGFRVIIHLTGSRQAHQNSDGSFSLELFKAKLDLFKDTNLASYIADGTVMGHLMFDEPQDPNNWNGSPVPFGDIEAAANYSKQLWPNMPVGVGGPPSFLQGGSGTWKALDFGYAQFTSRRGDAKSFVRQEVEAAHQAHLGLLIGINILGGNNRRPVTADQLRSWGQVLASDPAVCGLLMWRFDQNYLSDPQIVAALTDIGQIARARTSPACKP